MTFPNGITVTRLRATEVTDGYNGTRLDWDNPSALGIAGCAVAPRIEEEARERGRQGARYAWTLYCPYGSDIAFPDRIQTDTGTYEVEGPPQPWRNPYTGRLAGAAVHMRRVDG